MADKSDTSKDSDETADAVGSALPDDVADAAKQAADKSMAHPAPPWVSKYVWQSLWKVVAVGLATLFLIVMGWRAQTLLRQLGLSLFFALAIIPGVKHLHETRGWKRGAAVGAIYGTVVVFMILMVAVLIPSISDFAGEIGENGDEWVSEINDTSQDVIGKDLFSDASGDEAVVDTDEALAEWSDNVMGAVTSGIGLIFSMMTIALFTFYLAADWPKIQRALLARMPPDRQKRAAWTLDTAIEQTGGYFYSRLALMIINGSLFFVAMMLVGMPLVYSLPMAIFEAFAAAFIPAVGTYIGAAVPIFMTLAVQGFGPALALLIWTLIYQQGENLWLEPKLAAETMSINGGVAFGAALAGGAIAGPMGAFMALPIAALITSLIANSGKTYAVVYDSKYSKDDTPDDDTPEDDGAEGTA